MSEVSIKQLEANSQNAKLGGVKTDEGKAVSKFNALKHGILQKSLTDYEKDLYPSILEDLIKELSPASFLESMLVERIAMGYLRLFRVAKVEKEYMDSILHPRITESPMDELLKSYGENKVIKKGYIPVVSVGNVTQLDRTILRYEVAIERSLYKALHELQRLQATRRGEKPALPIAVDVDISKD